MKIPFAEIVNLRYMAIDFRLTYGSITARFPARLVSDGDYRIISGHTVLASSNVPWLFFFSPSVLFYFPFLRAITMIGSICNFNPFCCFRGGEKSEELLFVSTVSLKKIVSLRTKGL